MPRTEPVNVQRTIAFVGFFYFIYSAGKACLFPFLTIYFRHLGLTATQTGVILGVKPFAALLATPFWIHCAIRHNKRRVILMTAIFMMIAANLGLTLIPPVKDTSPELCQSSNHKLTNNSNEQNYLGPIFNKLGHYVFHTGLTDGTPTQDIAVTSPTLDDPTPTAVPLTTLAELYINSSTKDNDAPALTQRDLSGDVPDVTTRVASSKGESSRDDQTDEPGVEQDTDIGAQNQPHRNDFTNREQINDMRNDDKNDGLPSTDLRSENIDSLSDEDYEKARKYLEKLLGKTNVQEENWAYDLKRRAVMEEDFNETLTGNQGNHNKSLEVTKMFEEETMRQLEYITYMTVLVIVILGEVLASPADKICDDALYETLDHLDEVDKYGRHHFVSLFGMGIGAVVVSVAVHYSNCEILFDVHRIMIHFYAFAILCGMAFLLAFCYPMQDSGKTLKYEKLFRGLVLLLTDFNNIMVVITLVLVGFISASIQNYMFWAIQDLHGSEVIMGLTVAVSAVAEMPTLCASGLVTRKVGHIGVLGLATLALSARLLYFSYLWNPWAAIPIEILNMFCKGALWESAMLYAEHTAPPGMQRIMQVVMVVLYYGIGSSNGSVISGIIYDNYGRQTMFLCFSIVALFWSGVLIFVAMCVPKKRKLHYSKILRDEEDNNNEDDDIFDSSDDAEDWLVNALKKDTF